MIKYLDLSTIDQNMNHIHNHNFYKDVRKRIFMVIKGGLLIDYSGIVVLLIGIVVLLVLVGVVRKYAVTTR